MFLLNNILSKNPHLLNEAFGIFSCGALHPLSLLAIRCILAIFIDGILSLGAIFVAIVLFTLFFLLQAI
jgi:hypothetical protein